MTKEKALKWVGHVLAQTRGRELVGNYNPLLVGELFWEQSSKWKLLAIDHIEKVSTQCSQFLRTLLRDKCPQDIVSRLWDSKIHDALKKRSQEASDELAKLIEDVKSYPINYNHYYTDTIKSRRQKRQKAVLASTVKQAIKSTSVPAEYFGDSPTPRKTVDVDQILKIWTENTDRNMESFSCEEALDCLLAIYKVSQKTFIANVTTQVIERHIVRGLENIFSPVVVNAMSDPEVEAIASEPLSAKRQRDFLEDRIRKLGDGHAIFRGVMMSSEK